MSELIKVNIFKPDCFNKTFLVKFYHSSVYFCYLKCGTGVFGEPNNLCLCSCNRIAVSLVVFAMESDSLINYSYNFQSKNIFPWYLFFLNLLYNLRECLFQFVVSNFYHGDHKLIFHVLREMEICYLIFYYLGVFQVQLDVLSLEKLESLLVFCFCLCLM